MEACRPLIALWLALDLGATPFNAWVVIKSKLEENKLELGEKPYYCLWNRFEILRLKDLEWENNKEVSDNSDQYIISRESNRLFEFVVKSEFRKSMFWTRADRIA